MSVYDLCRAVVFRAAGRCYVPPALQKFSEKRILHISDTPRDFYPAVKRLINEIKPQVIVHTGDLADDIKLENNPGWRPVYREAVRCLVAMLETSSAGAIYIVPGNHDSRGVIAEYARRAWLMPEGGIISVGGVKVGLAHRVKRLPVGAEFNLYGHNFEPGPREDPLRYLNGLNRVNIIFYPSRRVVRLPYPYAMNTLRKMNFRCGLPNTVEKGAQI